MKTSSLVAGLALVLLGGLLAGCPRPHHHAIPINEENLYFKLTVESAGSAWQVSVEPPTVFLSAVTYPGVTATRVNQVLSAQAVSNNADASSLTLTLTSHSNSRLPRLWLVLRSTEGDLQLASTPDAENGDTQNFSDGEPIFVFGPLDPGQSAGLTLDFSRAGSPQPYDFYFDVLQVEPRLLYTSYSGTLTNAEVFSARETGNSPFQVTGAGRYAFYPAYAPGGERIAYSGLGPVYYDIYSVHPDGSHFAQVTHGPDSALHPAFSPDGKALVYDCLGRSTDSLQDICLNDAQGGHETVLINGFKSIAGVLPAYVGVGWYAKRVFLPSWSPDGTKVVFVTRHPIKYASWYFVAQEMDPATKTPIGNLVILNRPWDLLSYSTSHQWMTLYGPLNWGPDGSHAAFDAIHFTVATPPGLCFYPSCGPAVTANHRFMADYFGSWILDLTALMGDPQYGETLGPFLRDYSVPVLNGQKYLYSIETNYAQGFLSTDASEVTFTKNRGGPLQDVVALPLDPSYQPTSSVPETVISNKGQNSNPAWMPPLLPGFYH